MANRELRIAAVEIAHLASLNVCRADGEPRWAPVNSVEIHKIGQGRFERLCGGVGGPINRQWVMKSHECERIWREEAWYSVREAHPIRTEAPDPGNASHSFE